MPALSDPRHERFCQFLAQGKTATEAYVLAGYKPNRWNSAFLARQDKIRERLTHLNTKLAKVTKVTVETLVAESEEVRVQAMEARQFNAANAAIKGKAVLTGKWVERAEIGEPGEFDHLSDYDLLHTLRERFTRLQDDIRLDEEVAEEMRVASAPGGESQH